MKPMVFTLSGDTYVRITKATARKWATTSSHKIYCLPSKINPAFPFFSLAEITAKTTDDFEKFVNEYTFYNCNVETGYYLSYFVKVLSE